jgi:ribosomal protein S18 acetylase RimI-like enzyme
LADRGFLVEAYRYLSSAVVDDPPTVPFAPWSGHTKAMAALCARAYEGAGGVRAFAPSGTMAEWRDYIAGLVIGPGCGTFAGDFSFVVPGPRGQLDAAVLVTSIGARAVHVAQLAVDPRARGRQLGRNLVRAARSAAARAGHQCMTLLVAASNEHAVAIYEALGFRDRSAFLVASRNQPTLSTSVALATGGDSTRL